MNHGASICKRAAFVLGAVALLSAAGCGGSSNHDSAAQAQRRQQVRQLKVLQDRTRESKALSDYNSGS